MSEQPEPSGPPGPSVRVVRGNPTPEELAAALAVVRVRATDAGGEAGAAPRRAAAWNAPSRLLPRRHAPTPGPDAWRTSYWPV